MKVSNNFYSILIIILSSCFSYVNLTAQQKVGILVIAHGGNKDWNHAVNEAVEPLKKNYEVEIAFGMADPKTMQAGINKLENKGIRKIVVVPLFISSYSPIIRQTEFLLGLRKELADKPMLMNHSLTDSSTIRMQENNSNNNLNHHSNHSNQNTNNLSPQLQLYPLQFKSKVFLTHALDDNPLVIEIITKRIKELSKSPKNETIILVAHGPNDEEDNKNWIKTMENIADKLRKKFGSENKFRNIFCTTVRDDAPKEIYETAKENLRSIVRQAAKDGKVIVVPLLLAQGGIEKGIVERLKGLDYEWNGKTLLPDSNITKFIQQSVKNVLE